MKLTSAEMEELADALAASYESRNGLSVMESKTVAKGVLREKFKEIRNRRKERKRLDKECRKSNQNSKDFNKNLKG